MTSSWEPTLGRLARSGDALELPALLTEGIPALESDEDMSSGEEPPNHKQ